MNAFTKKYTFLVSLLSLAPDMYCISVSHNMVPTFLDSYVMVLNFLASYTMTFFFLAYYIMILSLLIILHHDTLLLSLVYQLGTFLLCLVYVYHGTSYLSFVYHVLSFLASNTMLCF